MKTEWLGLVYALKVQTKAAPEGVLKSLNKLPDADRKKYLSDVKNLEQKFNEFLCRRKLEFPVSGSCYDYIGLARVSRAD